MICDRCFKETVDIIMSQFNNQDICKACKDKEIAHQDHERAAEAEFQASKAGDTRFPGVGLPDDLRSDFIDAVIASEEHDSLLLNALHGSDEGDYRIDDVTDIYREACGLCKEPLGEKAFALSDSGEALYLCPPCGCLILESFTEKLSEQIAGIRKMRETLEGSGSEPT